MSSHSNDRSSLLEYEIVNVRGLSIRLGATLMVVIGLAVVAVSFYLDDPKIAFWIHVGASKTVVDLICSGLLRTIGASFFAVGFVDVLLGLPNFVKYMRSRIQEALIEHGPVFTQLFNDLLERDISSPGFLSTLSDEAIDKARHNLIVVREKADISATWQSSRTLANDIEPLLAGVTYKNLKVDVTNEVLRDRATPYIRSTRYYRAEYITQAERSLDLGFRRKLRPLDGFTSAEQYHLVELLVDNKPCDKTVTYAPADNGDGMATLELPCIVRPGQTLVIERREVALLPASDIYIWVCRPQRSLLCLNVDCRFTNEDLYPLIAPLGFPKGDGGKPREDAREAHLTWEGWMLPHHGFVLSWNDPAPNRS